MPSITTNISDTTFVSSAQPNNNMSSYPLMYTGTDTGFQNCTGLLKFTLPSLPVTKVDSAQLQLAVISKSSTSPATVIVNRVTSEFETSTVTYSTIPTFTATDSQIEVTQSDLYKNIQIDITDLVNSWLDGTYVNNGIALTCSDAAVQFATNAIAQEQYFPELILTYSYPYGNSAESFCYAQLSNVIQQLMTLYPAGVMTVYTKGTVYITGTPYELYASPDSTYGMLAIITDAGEFAAIPLNNITAVKVDSTTYDPSITYLTAPEFTPGSYANLILSMYNYLPLETNVTFYLGAFVEATGVIYKNEYGILVKTGALDGSDPVFIPVVNINALITPEITSLAETERGTKSVNIIHTDLGTDKKIII